MLVHASGLAGQQHDLIIKCTHETCSAANECMKETVVVLHE